MVGLYRDTLQLTTIGTWRVVVQVMPFVVTQNNSSHINCRTYMSYCLTGILKADKCNCIPIRTKLSHGNQEENEINQKKKKKLTRKSQPINAVILMHS